MPERRQHRLVLLSQARQLSANACSIEDVKQVRNVTEAARVFAKAAQMGLELQNQAAEVKLGSEHSWPASTFTATTVDQVDLVST